MTILKFNKLKRIVLARLIYWIVRIWTSTIKLNIKGEAIPQNQRLIYAFLHGNQFPLIRFPKNSPVSLLVSSSEDGKLQSEIYKKFGFDIIFGSSSKWGTKGLCGIIKKVKKGHDIAIAVDGPKGPYGEIKKGVYYIAQKTGASIVFLDIKILKGYILKKTWDKFTIPYPFTSVDVNVRINQREPELQES